MTYCSFDVAFLFYLSTQISTNIPDYGVFFYIGKLSDSETEKRLRNGPFAENARGWLFALVHHALERSAPDNLLEWCAACWSHRPSSKGSKNSARTAFSVAQDVERSLGSPRMLHGHLHQLHASSISCMLNRRVFHNMLPHSQGKFTTVQVDIHQPYVHFTKKKYASIGIPCILKI